MTRTLPPIQPDDPAIPDGDVTRIERLVNAIARIGIPYGSRVDGTGRGFVTFPPGYDQDTIDQVLLEVTLSPASSWEVLVMASDGPPQGHHILLVHGRSRGLDISVLIEPDGRGILDGWPTIAFGEVPEDISPMATIMRRYFGDGPAADADPELIGVDEVLLSGELDTALVLLMTHLYWALSPADLHVIDAMCRRLHLDAELDQLLSRPQPVVP